MDRPRREIRAIILAAGESRRMGSPKALLPYAGEPAISRIATRLHAGGVTSIMAVIPPSLRLPIETLFTRDDAPSVEWVENPTPSAGLAGSLRLALRQAATSCDAFLLAPVDVPLFEADDVRTLIDAFVEKEAAISIIAPSNGTKRGHPVLFSSELIAEFLALGDDEPPNLVVRRDSTRVLHVVMERAGLFRDFDTPDDYANRDL